MGYGPWRCKDLDMTEATRHAGLEAEPMGMEADCTKAFYIRDMSIHGFGHAQGLLNKSPIDTKGQLYKEKCWERSLKEKEGETLGLELQQ